MILNEFPNLEWLKKQAGSNFADQQGVNGIRLRERGWPSVVLNARSAETQRKDIRGPFSIFLNLRGQTRVGTERREFTIGTDTYCITNSGQLYDLTIPASPGATTFNIHFGERFFDDSIHSLRNHDAALLDRPASDGANPFVTFPRTVWIDREFRSRVDGLARFYRERTPDIGGGREEDLLYDILEHVWTTDQGEVGRMHSLAAVKPATRHELMKRVLRAVEYIHDRYTSGITLDDLSEASNLSKFHLQRTFRIVKGKTPHQYISALRLDKATELIENPEIPFSQIAVATGFSELASFSRFFFHEVKMAPTAYRQKISNPG